VSSISPPPAADATVGGEGALPYGRPVRRRIAVPLILVAGIALAAALLVLHDRVVYYRVASGSMLPTLPIGSRVAVEPGLQPKVGEIVVFHPPAGAVPATPVCGAAGQGAGFAQPCGVATSGSSRAIFIKRVVAGPGASVSISAGRAVVNGVTGPKAFVASCGSSDCDFPSPVRVPAGHYYVLGDNRGASDDSRFWGPVPAASIVGVVVTCAPLQTDCQPRG
jgi:signal peptidase I